MKVQHYYTITLLHGFVIVLEFTTAGDTKHHHCTLSYSTSPLGHHAVFIVVGAVALAEFLAESRHIQQLDLRQNEVKVGGLMALCLALKINRSLTCLHLDHNHPQGQVGAAIITKELTPLSPTSFCAVSLYGKWFLDLI